MLCDSDRVVEVMEVPVKTEERRRSWADWGAPRRASLATAGLRGAERLISSLYQVPFDNFQQTFPPSETLPMFFFQTYHYTVLSGFHLLSFLLLFKQSFEAR